MAASSDLGSSARSSPAASRFAAKHSKQSARHAAEALRPARAASLSCVPQLHCSPLAALVGSSRSSAARPCLECRRGARGGARSRPRAACPAVPARGLTQRRGYLPCVQWVLEWSGLEGCHCHPPSSCPAPHPAVAGGTRLLSPDLVNAQRHPMHL